MKIRSAGAALPEEAMSIFKKRQKTPENNVHNLVTNRVVRFVVIDDEPEILELVESLLQSFFNCQVACFPSIEAAEELLTRPGIKPDLIISDIKMDGKSGFSVIGILEERNLKIPVIFITGMGGDETEVDGYKILSKPFGPRDLIDLIVQSIPWDYDYATRRIA